MLAREPVQRVQQREDVPFRLALHVEVVGEETDETARPRARGAEDEQQPAGHARRISPFTVVDKAETPARGARRSAAAAPAAESPRDHGRDEREARALTASARRFLLPPRLRAL